jgi:hypothetical protein
MMQVHDAQGVGARRMHRAMDRKAGHVDPARGIAQDASLQVDLDQAGGADFIEALAEGIDQVVARLARHRGRDMGIDDVVPLPQRAQAVAGGEVDPDPPFGVADAVASRRRCKVHEQAGRSGAAAAMPCI